MFVLEGCYVQSLPDSRLRSLQVDFGSSHSFKQEEGSSRGCTLKFCDFALGLGLWGVWGLRAGGLIVCKGVVFGEVVHAWSPDPSSRVLLCRSMNAWKQIG